MYSLQAVHPRFDESSPTQDIGPYAKNTEPTKSKFRPFGADGLTFSDLIDVINPLHHIPVVGPIYRKITGDNIDSLPRITGSTLFMGPIGAGLTAADTILEMATGKDAGAHFIGIFSPSSENEIKDKVRHAEKQLEDKYSGSERMNSRAVSKKPYTKEHDKEIIPRDKIINSDIHETELAFTLSKADPVVTWAKAEIAYRAGIAARHAAVKLAKTGPIKPEYTAFNSGPMDLSLVTKPEHNAPRPIVLASSFDLKFDVSKSVTPPSSN